MYWMRTRETPRKVTAAEGAGSPTSISPVSQETFYLGTGQPKIKTASSASYMAGCGHGIEIWTVVAKIICATPRLCPLKRNVTSSPSFSPFSALLRQSRHTDNHNCPQDGCWATLWIWGALNIFAFVDPFLHKKVLKVIFYNCIDIMAHVIQAGFIFIYSLL